MEIKQILNNIGNWITNLFSSILIYSTTAKLVSILVFLVIAFISIKFLNFLSKPIKIAIVIISILLIISVASTLFT